MWWIGAAADGNDDDKVVDGGWKSEFDDIFIVDCISFEKSPTCVVIGSGLPCEIWLMSFCGPVKI